uniref:Rad60/SUMO-like domain-containing protein n=1 Tax=Peromyscus maniculatus bairdii TaxID=230844 RepID=A0A8C8U6R9_PERMB
CSEQQKPSSRVLQEGVKTENDHINLKVAGQDGSVVQFKIKRHTPLSKLMKAYCERQVGRETVPQYRSSGGIWLSLASERKGGAELGQARCRNGTETSEGVGLGQQML